MTDKSDIPILIAESELNSYKEKAEALEWLRMYHFSYLASISIERDFPPILRRLLEKRE